MTPTQIVAQSAQPEATSLAVASKNGRKARAAAGPATGNVEKVDQFHHHYRIIAGVRGGRPQAFAFVAARRVASAEADSLEEALCKLNSLLDERVRKEREARNEGVPTAHEYRDALDLYGTRLTSALRSQLLWHSFRPAQTASIDEISLKADTTHRAVLASYTRLGRHVTQSLHYQPEAATLQDQYLLGICLPVGGFEVLRLRPEFVAALRTEAV